MMDGFGFIISLMVSYFSFAMFSFWAMYSMSHYGWNGVHGCGMFSHISTYNNAQLDIIFLFLFLFLFFPSISQWDPISWYHQDYKVNNSRLHN
jgi:uncharacterized membrane protein